MGITYRMRKDPHGGGSYSLLQGRDLVGFCRQWGADTWEAKAPFARGWGHTPEEAFAKFVKHARQYEHAMKPVPAPHKNGKVQKLKPHTKAQPIIVLTDFGTVKFKEIDHDKTVAK